MYKKRAIEATINKTLNQFPVILLSGPRQVGKTTVLRQLLDEKYSYITMDDPVQRRALQDDPALFLKSHPERLLLDEIQYVPEAFSYLKMRVDEKQEMGQYALTGSQSFHMMKGVSDSLAGRVGILELQGLSLRERLNLPFNKPFIPTESYISERRNELVSYNSLWQTIHRGHMPRLALNPEFDWEIFYSSYVRTYIERDVRQLSQVADENLFMRFMTSVAARSGELINYHSISKEVGVSNDTIKRWISILESSGVVYLLQPYANNHLKRAIKTPKLYFMDTGLLSYLTRWLTPETLSIGAMSGPVFETFIVSEIIKSFLNVGIIRPPLYFYRDRDQHEIDLVIEIGDAVYPIEIKQSAKPDAKMGRHFEVLKLSPDKKLQTGTILCQYNHLIWLRDDLIALPIQYI